MSTPARPKSYKAIIKKQVRNSVIKRPTGERKRCIASPIRHDPTSRIAPSEVLHAPKTKRVRQSRLFPVRSIHPDEDTGAFSPTGSQLATQDHPGLPVPRLYFESEDFMEMYADEQESGNVSCDRESMSFLTQCMTDAFHTFIDEPALPEPERRPDSPVLPTLRSFETKAPFNDTTVPHLTENTCFHEISNDKEN